MTSVREYAILYTGARPDGGGGSVGGGNVLTSTAQHALGGPEHTGQLPAARVSVADAGELFTGTDVEAVLAELATMGTDTTLETIDPTGATETIDVSVARTWDLVLGDDTVVSLDGAGAGAWYATVHVIQPSSGGPYAPTFPDVTWFGGSPPTWSTDPDTVDVVTVWTRDGGTTWLGVPVGSGGSSVVLSDANPEALGTAAPGTSEEASRADHVHPAPTSGGELLTLDAGTVTPDDAGDDLEITHATVYGFDGTDGYYDAGGAVAGEEAILAFDPATCDYALVPLNC